MPTVTVLMSVYNGERYLADAVRSILAQTLEDFEFLIVDDGSTDGSPGMLAALESEDRRIRLLRNRRNIGLSESLNRGLREARSPLVARMDADDISHPARLERQVAFLWDRPEVDVVGSWIRLLGSHTVWRRPKRHDDIVALLCFETGFWHPTVMFRCRRRELTGLGDAIVYDHSRTHAEDYDLWVRLALDHGARFANIEEPLVDYRVHPDSITKAHAAAQVATSREIRRSQIERLGLSPSDAALEIHDLISKYRLGPESDLLARADDWLARLRDANDRTGLYPREAFRRHIERLAALIQTKRAARSGEPSAEAAE